MFTTETPAASGVVEGYLATLSHPSRRLEDGHWGLTVDVGGWPLDIGLAVRAGVLRAQAPALRAGSVSDHELLHRNRQLRLARYTHAADGTVWVEADLPAEAVTDVLVDRLLGSLVAAAAVIRDR